MLHKDRYTIVVGLTVAEEFLGGSFLTTGLRADISGQIEIGGRQKIGTIAKFKYIVGKWVEREC